MEFQKIRAAYELLDGQSRYRMVISVPAPVEFDWLSAFQGSSQAAAAKAEQPTPSISIRGRLQSERLELIYKDIKSNSEKSPFDYYALAILSDLVGNDPTVFFRWLLAGLKVYPIENGLLALLRQYLLADVPRDHVIGVLIATSQVITDDRFYLLTENLWHELLRMKPFTDFQGTLLQCEKNLKTHQIHGKIVLYLNLMGAAIWKADSEWIEAKYQFLSDHAGELTANLEEDYELVLRLRKYKDLAPTLARGEVRELIHQTIVQYFSLCEREADQSVISCQTKLATNAREILEAFPVSADGNCFAMLDLWELINADVLQRHQLATPILPNQVMTSVSQLLCDLDQSSPLTWQTEGQIVFFRYGLYLLVALAPWLLFSGLFNLPYFVLLRCGLSVAGLLLLHFKWKPSRLLQQQLRRKMMHYYSTRWRSRFVQLLEANPINHVQLSEAIASATRNSGNNLGFARAIGSFVPRDQGLAIFSMAIMYRN